MVMLYVHKQTTEKIFACIFRSYIFCAIPFNVRLLTVYFDAEKILTNVYTNKLRRLQGMGFVEVYSRIF